LLVCCFVVLLFCSSTHFFLSFPPFRPDLLPLAPPWHSPQLPTRQLHQLRLRNAVARGNVNDIVSTTMAIKESFFEAHGKEDFQLETLHLLRYTRTDLLRNNNPLLRRTPVLSSTSETARGPIYTSSSGVSGALGVSGVSTPAKPNHSLPDTYFTTSPVQTSLTLMKDTNDVQVAMKMFKNVLGFMGDRQYVWILRVDVTCGCDLWM